MYLCAKTSPSPAAFAWREDGMNACEDIRAKAKTSVKDKAVDDNAAYALQPICSLWHRAARQTVDIVCHLCA